MPSTIQENIWFFLTNKAPKDPPNFVTRYQSWDNNKHRDALVKSYLFFSNPNDWPDKNDCKFILRFGTQREEVIQEILELSKTDPSAKDLTLEKREEILRSFADDILEAISSIAQRDEYARRFGIVCFSRNIDEKTCWEKYTDNQFEDAFAIIFDYNQLLNLYYPLIEIDYKSKLMEFTRGDGTSPDFRLATILGQKEVLKYGWEGEVRMVGFFPEKAIIDDGEIPDEARKVVVPKNIFHHILVHKNSSNNLESKISQALKDTDLKDLVILRQS